jgi:hypothetical protein
MSDLDQCQNDLPVVSIHVIIINRLELSNINFFLSCMILRLEFANMFSFIFLARCLSMGKNLKLYKTW